ncbi:flippase [Dyadobacter sandarakinus]|uniref:flippase n=1 Tax=Dyadobacter sandarakinus TaxID=2747268 RepID=UPI001E28E4B4|nr:flippase [Dyadobacter sandarakinus]
MQNVFWLAFDKALRIIIGLLVGIWVARYLGPAQWGKLNYILAIIGILIPLCNLGMDGFLVKSIVQNPQARNELLGTAFVSRIAILPIAFGAASLFLFASGAVFDDFLLFVLLSCNFLIAPFDLIDIEFQARLQSRLTVISKNTAYIIGAAGKIYLITSHKPLFWFAAIMGLETLLSYAFLVFIYQKRYNLRDWKFSSAIVNDFVRTCWPFVISNVAIILYMRVDQLMIEQLSGTRELGLFSSVVRLSELFLFIPVAVCSSYMPTLINHQKEANNAKFLSGIQTLMNWMTRISLGSAIVVSLFADQIIHLLFGPEFNGASDVLIIYIWSIIPVYLGVAASQYLIIENLQKYSLFKTLSGLIMNIVLNLLLIPWYGAKGAAIATVISYSVSAILSNAFFNATRLVFRYQLDSFSMLFKVTK